MSVAAIAPRSPHPSATPLKVVLVTGVFPADTSLAAALSERVNLVAYGCSHRLPGLTYQPEPPQVCAARSFRRVLPSTSGGHLRWAYRGLGAALSEDAPDVVHVVSEPWGMLAVQATAWARRNPGVVFGIHACDRRWSHGIALERAVREAVARYTLGRVDAYAAESPEAAARARDRGLGEDTPTAALHTNPRDPAVFRPARDVDERRAARRALGLPTEGVAVGFAGRLVPEKGPSLVIEALRLLRAEGAGPTWFALAGGGPDETRIAAETSAAGGLFLRNLRHPDDIALFHRSVDVVAVPSYRTSASEEQSPRVVAEAMMSGCVVVGSRSGAIPQMIGDAGVLVAERDPAALARGLRQALAAAADPDLRARARTRAISLYSGETVAERLLGLWADALRQRERA